MYSARKKKQDGTNRPQLLRGQSSGGDWGGAGALKDKRDGGCGGQVNEKIKDVEGDRMRQNRCTERLK